MICLCVICFQNFISQNLTEAEIIKELNDNYNCYTKNKKYSPKELSSKIDSELSLEADRLAVFSNIIKSDIRYSEINVDTLGIGKLISKLHFQLESIQRDFVMPENIDEDWDTSSILIIQDYKTLCEIINEIILIKESNDILINQIKTISDVIHIQNQIDELRRKSQEEELRKKNELIEKEKLKRESEDNQVKIEMEEKKYKDWKDNTRIEIPYEITIFTNEKECQYCFKVCSSYQYNWPNLDFSSYPKSKYMNRLFLEEKNKYSNLFYQKYSNTCPTKYNIIGVKNPEFTCKESRSGEHAWKIINKIETVSKLKFKN